MIPDLRALDRRVLPVAARGLRRLLDAAERQGARLRTRATTVAPLGRRAQVGLLVLTGAVLLAGTATAVLLREPRPAGRPAGPDLGVPPGTDVDEHLAAARADVVALAASVPDTPVLALVHLSRAVPVVELPALVVGTEPQQAYLRAGEAGPDAEVVPVPLVGQDAAVVLPALCAATSQRKAQDATSFAELAAAGQPQTPEEQAGQAEFAAEAERAAAEAEGFDGACVTVFAALVEAPAATLAALAERPGVRGVEPAPAGVATTDLDVQPLLPEQTGALPSGRER